jgi:hypothetical protein
VVNEPSARRVSNGNRAHFTFQYEVQGRHQQIRYNPAQPQEITIEDLNVRSFREPLKLGGWGTGLLLIGLVLRKPLSSR